MGVMGYKVYLYLVSNKLVREKERRVAYGGRQSDIVWWLVTEVAERLISRVSLTAAQTNRLGLMLCVDIVPTNHHRSFINAP